MNPISFNNEKVCPRQRVLFIYNTHLGRTDDNLRLKNGKCYQFLLLFLSFKGFWLLVLFVVQEQNPPSIFLLNSGAL